MMPSFMQRLGSAFGSFKQTLTSVPSRGSSWLVHEPFTGAWQRNISLDSIDTLLTFSAVYSCTNGISSDIGKLRPKLLREDDNGIWTEVKTGAPFLPVLRKPNHYQTRVQFYESWIISRLLWGNAYVLKERDGRGVVIKMYVLDPRRVTPLVTEDGGVYYQIASDQLAGVEVQITVPASEIIHDRHCTLWHPLVGVSPIFACARTATQGNRIQNNSAKFFENMSRPSGMLTAPGSIDDVTAKRLKEEFEKNFSAHNLGRLFVAGQNLKYEPMTITSQDAQLIEQLKWTVEDVARCFRMPLWKIGAGQMPAYGNSEMAQRAYYSETLQNIIESIEILLDEGLELPAYYGVEFDLEALLRMDTKTLYETMQVGVTGGFVAPNEARRLVNLPPVDGGETPYMQQQNWSLAAMDRRDSQETPPGTTEEPNTPALPAPDPEPEDDEELSEEDKAFASALIDRFQSEAINA